MTKPILPLALVLDAMGVIYSVGDDVANLLWPFISERNSGVSRSRVESLYHETSLGHFSSAEFWRTLRVDPALEDDYLKRHDLSCGLMDFLGTPPSGLVGIWCLSNDVSEWSRKLRHRFGLEQFIRGFVVSGDVGARKPDSAIFQKLFEEVNLDPSRIIFVDDRLTNLDAAKHLGMKTVLFASDDSVQQNCHRMAANFRELRTSILEIIEDSPPRT